MIKAIETHYAGCRFRSRLEARWAVFFNTLSIAWEYEPEGFEWEAQQVADSDYGSDTALKGGRYLPDFWLPSIQTWFEVKGSSKPTEEEYRIAWEFSIVKGRRHIMACGDIPKSGADLAQRRSESMFLNGGCDFNYWWCVCPWCGKPGIEFDGRGARVCGWRAHHDTEKAAWRDPRFDSSAHWRIDDKCYTFDSPRLDVAYAAARSARFEYGESG